MTRRTKVVCTLGPAVDSKPKIKALIDAGMNVARINCSHGDWATRSRWIQWISDLQPEVAPIGVLVDLQGPKLRIGDVANGELKLKPGTPVTIANKGEAHIMVPDVGAWESISNGDTILLGDGGVSLAVIERKGSAYLCRTKSGGTVHPRQGMTLVGKSFDVPAITEKDKKDLQQALKLGVDFIAISYVRSVSDVTALRKLIARNGASVKVVAKIETREALANLDEVIHESDVVMVARGDLGLQMSFDEVPVAQKRIIAACNARATPVITATQMLESMVHSPRPTRAEASDVANAILDGTDAVMLSGETAMGDYPIEAVKTMCGIAAKAEPLIDRGQRATRRKKTALQDAETDSVALAAVGISATLKTKAILTSSTSGMTPRLVSRYRPAAAVYCVAWSEVTQRQLSVVWGVEAVHAKLPKGTDAAVATTVKSFLKLRRIKPKERVVVTAGVPAGVPGKTNMILVLDV